MTHVERPGCGLATARSGWQSEAMRDHFRNQSDRIEGGSVGYRLTDLPSPTLTDDGGCPMADNTNIQHLVEVISRALIEASNPQGYAVNQLGDVGASIAYDSAEVIEALAWVAGSVAVQSGDYPSARDLRQLADRVRDRFKQACRNAEEIGRRGGFDPVASN